MISRLAYALDFAFDAHHGQVRKATDVPYISHPMAVASLVAEMGGGRDAVFAALLHDVIEDAQVPIERIDNNFGLRVGNMVGSVTEPQPAEGQPKLPWKERKVGYLKQMDGMDPQNLLVVLADKLHNARATLMDRSPERWERFSVGVDHQEWWYRSVYGRLRARRHELPEAALPHLDDLGRIIGELFGEPVEPGVITSTQAWEQFDALALRVLGIDGPTFVRMRSLRQLDLEDAKVSRVDNMVPVGPRPADTEPSPGPRPNWPERDPGARQPLDNTAPPECYRCGDNRDVVDLGGVRWGCKWCGTVWSTDLVSRLSDEDTWRDGFEKARVRIGELEAERDALRAALQGLYDFLPRSACRADAPDDCPVCVAKAVLKGLPYD